MSDGYFSIPRSLSRDPLWMDLPLACKQVFLIILDHAVYVPTKHNDHGHIIDLSPGQYCGSYATIQELMGKDFSRVEAERAAKKLILVKFLRQEVRHRKSIFTISHQDTYDLIKKNFEARNEANLRQTMPKSEANFEAQSNKSIVSSSCYHAREKEEKMIAEPERIVFRCEKAPHVVSISLLELYAAMEAEGFTQQEVDAGIRMMKENDPMLYGKANKKSVENYLKQLMKGKRNEFTRSTRTATASYKSRTQRTAFQGSPDTTSGWSSN